MAAVAIMTNTASGFARNIEFSRGKSPSFPGCALLGAGPESITTNGGGSRKHARPRNDCVRYGDSAHALLKGQPDPERRAAAASFLGPDLSLVRFDDGARDRQPHAHAFGLAGEERLKNILQFVGRDARAAVGHFEFG